MKRKKYEYTVVALGLEPYVIARNVAYWRNQGFTLVSTYMDKNRATVDKEPSVCGVFESWVKVKR